MTLPNTISEVSYVGSPPTTEFPFPYLVRDADHLQVYHDSVIQMSGYTVSGVGTDDVLVTYSVAPGAGVEILIRRVVPLTQLSDYVENDPLPAATLEADFDLLAMGLQQLESDKTRTLRVPPGEVVGSMVLPSKDLRASMIMAFDAAGLPTVLSALDQSATTVTPSPGGTPRFLGDMFGDVLNVKNFGAAGDGVQDDTAAVAAAIATVTKYGNIYFPAGKYVISSGYQVTNKHMSFYGDGAGATQIHFMGTGPLFNLERSEDLLARYTIRNMLITTGTTGVATAILVSNIDDALVVISTDNDVLRIEDVIIDVETLATDKWWLYGIELRNFGGVFVSNVAIRNGNSSDAQSDTNTKGIFLNASNPDAFVIRGISVSNIWIMRFHQAIGITGTSFESLYLTNFEIVCTEGIALFGGVHASAIFVSGGHMDNAHYMFSTHDTSSFAMGRFVGMDIRLGANGVPYFENATAFNIQNNSGPFIISACSMTGHTFFTGLASHGIIVRGATHIGLIDTCSFQSFETGIFVTDTASNIRIGMNNYDNVNSNEVFTSTGSTVHGSQYWKSSPLITMGGTANQLVDVPIPFGLFNAKPEIAFLSCSSPANRLNCYYDYEAAETSENNCRFLVVHNDNASNLPVGILRFSFLAYV